MRYTTDDMRNYAGAPVVDFGVKFAMKEAADEIDKLRAAGQMARSALDKLMGDTDLSDDDTPEMKAMLALNAVLPDPA